MPLNLLLLDLVELKVIMLQQETRIKIKKYTKMAKNNPPKKIKISSQSSSSTDSTASYNRDEMMKRGGKTKTLQVRSSTTSKPNSRGVREETIVNNIKRQKETPNKSAYSFKRISYGADAPSDSSYKQVVKKPTETKAGSVKTRIKSENVNIKTKTPIPKKKK